MSIKDRLIQFVLRGKDELSPAAKKSAEAMEKLKQEAASLGKALADAKGAAGMVQGLETTQRAAEQTERAITKADLQIKELREALNASPEAAGLQQSLASAEREGRRLQKQLDKLKTSLVEQEKAAREAGVDTGDLAGEQKRLAAEVERTKATLTANTAEVKALEREQAKATRTTAEHGKSVSAAREAMSHGAKQVLSFAAAYISLNAAFGLVQKGLNLVRDGIYSMLSTGDEFAKLDKRLASLMGSVAAGEEATRWIKQFAKDTPLEVRDVTEAFALLKSYGLDPMGGVLRAIVDKNEQLGGGMERLSGLAAALGQAYAKQKLQTEEILQLVERGVPVWGMLEKITGKTAAQLQELASKGKLGRDVIKALIDEIGKSATGAAAANMTELTGLVSTLGDVWSDFLNRAARSGALDFAKDKLKSIAEYIDKMDADGSLDRLAKAMSDTFVNAAESVEKYIKQVGKLDFAALAEQASEVTKQVGPAIDQAVKAGQYATATLSSVWNTFSILVTSSAAVLAKAVQLTLGSVLLAGGQVAGFFGGSEIKVKAEGLYTFLGDLSTGYVAQAKTDMAQVGASWDFLTGKALDSAQQQADAAAQQTGAVKTELEQQRMLDQAHADHLVANQQRIVDAAASGKAAITDIAAAINLIDTTKTVQQVDGLRTALFKAFQDGKLSLDEYQQASNLLGGKLKELGVAAGGAADLVSDLDEKLGDLASVQASISNAKTDVDINNIRTALRKLYSDGSITAAEYNAESKKTSDRQKELKAAIDDTAKAQRDKINADKEAIDTSIDLRRESGKSLDAERKAIGEAMELRRKGITDEQRDVTAVEDFYSGVMTRARAPLAALSVAALAAFDKLRGLGAVDVSLDTSGLEETTRSLARTREELAKLELAASTVGMSFFGKWQTSTAVQSKKIQAQYLEQKLSLQSLIDAHEKGRITLDQFSSQAVSARKQLSLLDQSDLSQLDSSIASAKQQMQQLAESSAQTLAGVMDELDKLEGRDADIEQRRMQSRKRELEAQLSEAQAGGDSQAISNLQRALSTFAQIQTLTEQKSAQAAQKAAQEQRAAQAPQPTQIATTSPAQVIRIEMGSKAANVLPESEADGDALLGILESAGLRSIG